MNIKVFAIINLLALNVAFADGSLQNINLTAAADILAPVSQEDSEENQMQMRSAEFMLYAPVDHNFDAVLNFAGHDHDGEFTFSLHEGYISSSKIIPQSRFKIGKYFLGIGRLNQFHQHYWPFVTPPKVHREFFSPGSETMAAEGAVDTGAEYSWLLPTEHFFEITLGITNGNCYGHCHESGDKPPRPLFYLHPITFFDWGTEKGLQLGLSYLNRKNSIEVETALYGVDVTYKQKEGKFLKWLVQSEIYYQKQTDPTGDFTEKAGAYIYPQYGFDENLFAGLRFDAFSQLNLKFTSNNASRKNLDYAIVPNLTYKSSEFATFRLEYAHQANTLQGAQETHERIFSAQAIFILGAHPAHDF